MTKENPCSNGTYSPPGFSSGMFDGEQHNRELHITLLDRNNDGAMHGLGRTSPRMSLASLMRMAGHLAVPHLDPARHV